MLLNGQPWTHHDGKQVFLPYEDVPAEARIEIALGGAAPTASVMAAAHDAGSGSVIPAGAPAIPAELKNLEARMERIGRLRTKLTAAGLGQGYETAHARLAMECFEVCRVRLAAVAAGTVARLPGPAQAAADHSYVVTAERLCEGLEKVLESYAHTGNPAKKRIAALWAEARAE